MTDRLSSLRRSCLLAALALASGAAAAEPVVSCDMSGYRKIAGLSATDQDGTLTVRWRGEPGIEGRLELQVAGGAPLIGSLALRKRGGAWTALASQARPEFFVTTGLRRMSGQQMAPLRALGVEIDQAALEKHRWAPFRDAPLDLSAPVRNARGRYPADPPPVEGVPGTDQPGLPRRPEEIGRARAEYRVDRCAVRSDGARLEVTYPGASLGVFEGALRFTVYRGTNLIKMEIAAVTAEKWVAYKYDAGLAGLAGDGGRVAWRDAADGGWRAAAPGDDPHADRLPLKAANRLVVAEWTGGSIAAFPPPHKFFWARQSAVNLGYNWRRTDADGTFAIGVRQSEREEAERYQATWALYNARPGTEQQMAMFLYPSLGTAAENAERVLAFTHGDRYRPLPDYKVMNHHYHMDLGARLLEEGPDAEIPDLAALRALGINIVSQVDPVVFRGSATRAPDGAAPRGAGRSPEDPDQLAIAAAAFDGARRRSDKDFLVMASQEIYRSPLGGHTDLLFGRPVYWDRGAPGQPLVEPHPVYGEVYHIGDAEDLMAMVRAENILVSMPHPRTKGSAGYPEAIRDEAYFRDPHYDGVGLRWGMGLDGSERRSCEYRCLPLLDEMSNWMADGPGPLKHAISISEVRHQAPGDDIYGGSPVTYLKLTSLPPPGDARPVIDALRRGDSFWTTGEVLIPRVFVKGAGASAAVVAEVEWTFPLDFVEVVWGDGEAVGRAVVTATHLPPFGRKTFEIPIDLAGKKWVRFAAWDTASEGAFTQPARVGPDGANPPPDGAPPPLPSTAN